MRTRKPLHLKTFDYLGVHRYSLTICTDQRRPLFKTADAVLLVLSQISRSASDHDFAILAYCFMPDHLHLLVEGLADASDFRRFVTSAKQYSGFHYHKMFGRGLWQRYVFEHVLRDDEVMTIEARHILENPVRAGFVQNVEDYPFVGSKVYSLRHLLEGTARSG